MLIAPKWLNLRTSYLTHVFPGTIQTWPPKFSQKGAWPGSRDPLNFWALNANSSKTVRATYFNFETRVSRDNPDMTPKNFPKGVWPWSRDPQNFWALNANSSETVKATDFKFDTRVPRDSPDMTPNFFPKRGVFKNLLGGDMHSHERLLVILFFIHSCSVRITHSLLWFSCLCKFGGRFRSFAHKYSLFALLFYFSIIYVLLVL